MNGRLNIRRLRGLLCLAWLGLPMAFSCQADDAHAGAAKPATPTDQQLADNRCVIGLEKFLPADYYYCLASQSYGQHQYRYAQRFFSEAASWASKPAQYVLGVMALHGDQQPVNRPLALAWFALAAERHTQRFERPYQALRAKLSKSELAQADALLARMTPVYGDAVAAPRAETRYRQGMLSVRSTAAAGNYCMEGQADFSDLAGPSGTPDASAIASRCPPTELVMARVDKQAEQVFEDWHGHVVVGPLEAVHGPAQK